MTREEAINEIKSWDFLEGKEIEAIHTLIPELAESEDERIRKEIIKFFEGVRPGGDKQYKERIDTYIAWLEKQKDLVKKDDIIKELGLDPEIFEYDNVKMAIDGFEKLHLRTPIKDCIMKEQKLYVSETMNEKDSFDRGFTRMMEKEQKPAEWSIKDAKPGDVLNSTRVQATIIFKGFNPDGKHIDAYCALQKGVFISSELPWDRDFEPATDEWKKRLFNAMKEKGYEFDANNLKLRPINIPAEWGEEEEKLLNIIIDILDREEHNGHLMHGDLKACVKLLKSLPERFPVQPKQEWSGEDEKPYKDVLSGLKYAHEDLTNKGSLDTAKDIKEAFDWMVARFKSLHPQPHTVSIKDATKFGNLEYERGVKDGIQSEKSRQWKPSEEQMRILRKYVIGEWRDLTIGQDKILTSLYNDLKKL